MLRYLIIAAVALGGIYTSGQEPTVTLNGTSYTLQPHPRVWLDGPSGTFTSGLLDPDGSGSQTARRASASNPSYAAALANVNSWTAGNLYQQLGNQANLKDGNVALNAALVCYGDNSQTAACSMATWLLDHIESLVPLICNLPQQGCGQSNYGAESYGVTYWMPNWAQAYSIMETKLSSTERQNFAAKMLNDISTYGGVNGAPTTTCTDPTVVNASLTFTGATNASNVTTITTNLSVFGTSINVGDWVTPGGANVTSMFPGVVMTINSPTSAVIDASSGSYAFNVTTATPLLYRSGTFSAGQCGWMWYAKHERFNPNDIIGYPANEAAYSDGGIYGSDGLMNLTVAGYRGFASLLTALADDDPNASSRAIPELTDVYNGWYTKSYTPALDSFTLNSNNGSGYGTDRKHWTTMTALVFTRSFQSPPSLMGPMVRNLMAGEYMTYYPAESNAHVQFGQQGVDGSWLIDTGVGSLMAAISAYPSSTEAGYLQYFLQSVWTNQNSGYGTLWNSSKAGLTSANFQRNGPTEAFIYLFYDPANTALNLSSAPLQLAPSSQTGAHPLQTLVSRTGFTNLNDTLMIAYAHNFVAGFETDHGNPYNPGSYKIIKNVPMLSEDEGSGQPINLNANGFSGYWQQSNYIQIGSDANISANNGVNVTMPRVNVSDSANRYAYAMIDLSSAYLSSANVGHIHRHLIDFKKSGTQQFVIDYTDVALTSGNTIKGFYHYVNNGQTGEGNTSISGNTVTSSFPGTGIGDATQLLTSFLSPETVAVVTDNPDGSYTGGNGQTFRVTACGSSDGATCNTSATAAEWIAIHEPVLGTSNSMPVLTLPACSAAGGTCRAVQVAGSSPKVAVFAQGTGTLSGISFTSTHTGTAQYMIAGLAPGSYIVTINGSTVPSSATVSSGDTTLYFESTAGSVVVSQSGAISLSGITVTPGNATLQATGTQQFTATCLYSNGTNSNCTSAVTWSSSTPAVASISSTGIATALAAGNTTISASTGGIAGTAVLTVSAPTLTSIAVTPSTASIVAGTGSQQYLATCSYSNSTTSNCTQTVQWSSSNPADATINNGGLATGVAAGSTIVSATSGSTAGTSALTVTSPGLLSITLTPSAASVQTAATQQFTASCAYANNTNSNCTSAVSWTSSNTSIATASAGGLVTGIASGSSTIKATSGATTSSAILTVTGPTLTSITVSPSAASIVAGTGTQQYSATCFYSNSTNSNCTSTVTWSSSNLAAATIANTGLAAGVAAGTSTIAANSGTTSGTGTLTVTNPTLTSIAVTPGVASIVAGSGTQQFTATCRYSNSTSSDCTSTATWKSSNLAVATISAAGMATAVTAGPVVVTAAFGSITGTGFLTVTSPALKSILVTPGTVSIPAGTGIQQFLAKCQYSDSTNKDCTSTVTWSSSNQAAAPIATSGVASARQSGTATITAASGSVTASSVLTVLPASALQSARNGEWAWMDGSSTAAGTSSPLVGVRGTLGMPDSANVPAGREESVSWTDSKGNLWVFGGQGFDSAGNDGDLNDLWEFVPSSQKWAWISGSGSIPGPSQGQSGVYGSLGVAETGNTPGGRVASVGWTDSSGNLWLFGGEGYDSAGVNGKLNDLWKFAPSSQEWTWVGGSNTVPASSKGQTGVYGKLGVPAATNVPGGRWGANSWTDSSGKFWLFGGVGYDSTGSSDDLNDLWVFDPSTNEWTWAAGSSVGGQPGIYGALASASTTNAPGGRSQAISWTDSNGNFWLFGGTGYDSTGYRGYLNDLWEFSNATNQWTWIGGSSTIGCLNCGPSGIYGTLGTTSATNIPGGRSQAVAWTDASGNLWLFGGQGVDSAGNVGDLNDLWEFALSTHQWIWMGGSTTIPAANTGQPGVYGTSGIPAIANTPGGRLGAVSWSDSSGDLWLFGGNGYDSKGTYDSLDDLWVYQTTPGTLPAATPVFDVASGTYNSQQVVTVSDATPGAVIYYTTDGTSPTAGSNAYSGPISVSSSEALKAIAVVSQYGPSAVAISNYTITPSVGIGISAASSNLVTVQSGGTAKFSFVVSPVGGATFPAAISFKASGLPTGAIATFTPATIAAGAGVSNVSLSIQLSNPTAALHRSPSNWGLALCLLFLPLAGLGSMQKLARKLNAHEKLLLWCVVIAGSVLTLSGCGGTKIAQIQSISSSSSSAPYVVTITATSGQLQQTTTINLAIQ